ncbi:hypothetical protein [Mediterraneibacter sp. NSJ-151]|nr:hypothetical protein [Mediterraneibacter sp. NSJ-151]
MNTCRSGYVFTKNVLTGRCFARTDKYNILYAASVQRSRLLRVFL